MIYVWRRCCGEWVCVVVEFFSFSVIGVGVECLSWWMDTVVCMIGEVIDIYLKEESFG